MEIGIEELGGNGPRVTSTPLPRRAVLRGAGVALALPWLEAMAPASTQGDPTPPRRLLYVYSPNGINMSEWRQAVPQPVPHPAEGPATPPQRGAWPIEELPSLLEPLAPWSGSLQILRGLTQDKARAHGDGPGDHARAAGNEDSHRRPSGARAQ